MAVETVQATTGAKIEFRFQGPVHLLVVYEEGVRCEGETFIEGAPRSTLRELRRKLAFVPAGHEYREWQQPRLRSRLIYIYFDPAKMPGQPHAGPSGTPLAPRSFFENNGLCETAVKLATLIEDDPENRSYREALFSVLAHELVRLNSSGRAVDLPVRGGLAAWQQRVAKDYIEKHLTEQIPLATLAQLVRLSPHYLCRAFKRSFGIPPHRYHSNRRVERAKVLLANPTHSVTDVALTLGFSDTSSFTAAFRKMTGATPTAYRRSVE